MFFLKFNRWRQSKKSSQVAWLRQAQLDYDKRSLTRLKKYILFYNNFYSKKTWIYEFNTCSFFKLESLRLSSKAFLIQLSLRLHATKVSYQWEPLSLPVNYRKYLNADLIGYYHWTKYVWILTNHHHHKVCSHTDLRFHKTYVISGSMVHIRTHRLLLKCLLQIVLEFENSWIYYLYSIIDGLNRHFQTAFEPRI